MRCAKPCGNARISCGSRTTAFTMHLSGLRYRRQQFRRSKAGSNSMRVIDLRSDTVTKPSPAMRRAMAEAEVGDDVYLEDPSINRLQERAAEMFGREAALFVPTGSMGNTIAIKIHTKPGQ